MVDSSIKTAGELRTTEAVSNGMNDVALSFHRTHFISETIRWPYDFLLSSNSAIPYSGVSVSFNYRKPNMRFSFHVILRIKYIICSSQSQESFIGGRMYTLNTNKVIDYGENMAEAKFIVFEDGRVLFRYGKIQKESPFEVEIHCSLTSRMHGEHEEIQKQHRDWARSFNILSNKESVQKFYDTRFDVLTSYQYHDLPVELAVLASNLMTWFFVFDDVMDSYHGKESEVKNYQSKLCKRHLDVLIGESPQDNDVRCVHAFYDFLRKSRLLSRDSLSPWYERMVYHLREYILGTCWESLMSSSTVKSINTALYQQIRHMTVGVAPCHDLMAIAKKIPAEPILENLFIRRLERMAINYSIWVNDIAGLGRDMKRGLGNVILTFQRDHSLTLTEAAQMVARMCDKELEAFLAVEKQLPTLLENVYKKDREVYEDYMDVLKRWMRGLVDWSARSDRYQRLDVDMTLLSGSWINQALQKNHPD